MGVLLQRKEVLVVEPVVRFHSMDEIAAEQLTFAVIITRMNSQWVFCRHKQRDTWECPGGHIEPGETPVEAAHRELYEETGAQEARIDPVCIYSVGTEAGPENFGLLCYAEVSAIGPLPESSEMACVKAFSALPANWTYPHIQPHLLKKCASRYCHPDETVL